MRNWWTSMAIELRLMALAGATNPHATLHRDHHAPGLVEHDAMHHVHHRLVAKDARQHHVVGFLRRFRLRHRPTVHVREPAREVLGVLRPLPATAADLAEDDD